MPSDAHSLDNRRPVTVLVVDDMEVNRRLALLLLRHLGYAADSADRAQGFTMDWAHLDYIEQHDQSPARWDQLKTARPGPLRFYYRQSPLKMFSDGWTPQLPWLGPPELGRISEDEPPLNVPGMTKIVVDTEGRLTSFAAVPPRLDPAPGPFPEPDWQVLLREAGLDPDRLSVSAPRFAAWADSDRKAAWDGTYSGQKEVPLHIEAAAYHGRPVYFEVQLPWTGLPSAPDAGSPLLEFAVVVVFLSIIPIVGAGIVLIRRNIRMGRGDRRGAFRLGLLTFATLALAQGFRADHTSVGRMEYALLVLVVSLGCSWGLAVWAFYMAIEPAVRRRWPHMLISWNRLLAGRFKDPLVARDVLAGVLLGLGVALAELIGSVAPTWFGQPGMLWASGLSTLIAPRHMAFYFFLGPCLGIVYSLSVLFNFYLIHALVRRMWLSRAILFSFIFLIVFATGDSPIVSFVVAATFAGLVVVALTRFGLLCSAVLLFTFLVVGRVPLTLDWSAWYAGRCFAVLGFFAALLVAAAYTSLGGKPLFGKALLDD